MHPAPFPFATPLGVFFFAKNRRICYTKKRIINFKIMVKKEKKSAPKSGGGKEDIIREVEAIGGEIKRQALVLKRKFDRLDEQTKKKVVTGVAGAAAVLLALHKIKKIGRKK